MLPEDFLDRMKQMLGEEYPAFLQSLDGERYRGLRVNTRKTDVAEFLGKCPFDLTPVPWTENGFYYPAETPAGKHAFHEAGVYYIQEPSAMAPVPFLGVKPGDRVLDLCAAPGGKSTQIADFLRGEGILVCNEIHPARARILSENIERMGVVNALVLNETPERLAGFFTGYFDKILVDAPCSGEGMFRKNEEAYGEWSLENVRHCAERQDGVLDCAAEMLRPGGRMVYSTCTFAPAEDEDAIARFLERHPEFRVVPAECPEGFTRGVPGWAEHPMPELADTLRLMPHKLKGEGHFLAVLEKRLSADENLCGVSEAALRRPCKNGTERGISQKEYAEWLDFKAEWLTDFSWEGIYIRFGDQLYLGVPELPALKGLKVLRPGLHLGTIKKNRFEPSHALALAIAPRQVKQVAGLAADSPQAAQYLNGMTLTGGDGVTIRGGDAKGWCLVCVDGYSLGWAKAAGGVLKNHYPKGLRKY